MCLIVGLGRQIAIRFHFVSGTNEHVAHCCQERGTPIGDAVAAIVDEALLGNAHNCSVGI